MVLFLWVNKMKIIAKLLKDENGAAAIEYALIVSLIALAAVTAIKTVGLEVSNTFSMIASALDSANSQ